MRNRLSNGSKHVALAACMLALGANFSACTDDYVLDEQKPAWLNSSIYETIKSDGNYQNYLTLLSDPDVNTDDTENDWASTLSRTGSKTVLIAKDQAWDQFFKKNATLPTSNPWHYAQSYEQLSASQKKLILYNSMLPNAIVMENLSTERSEQDGETTLKRGMVLRRETDIDALDTVAYIAVDDLPKTYWDADLQKNEDEKELVEVDQWSRIRHGELGYKHVYLLNDNSAPMLLHFTNEYLASNAITDDDFRIFMGRERSTQDVHIFDALLDSTDIVCENGYINMTEKPLTPLPNMAEIIRTNGKTNIFSHMLDRFSVPVFSSSALHDRFVAQNPAFQDIDTLYVKRYYSQRSYGGKPHRMNADEAEYKGALLRYDPGWNQYFPATSTAAGDMGAMFIPSDKRLLEYFNAGGVGRSLIEEYASEPTASYNLSNLETLYRDIDQIPMRIIYAIINYCMFESFVTTVPSKMTRLREEVTLEQIFLDNDNKLTKDDGTIDTVMMACNGAVYIMDRMMAPSDFTSVASPAFIRTTNKVIRWAIYSDAEQARPKMCLNFYAYLKAMQSRFTFFLPCDEAMKYYYDPMSFTARNPRLIRFLYTGKGDVPIKNGKGVAAVYNVQEGTIGNDIGSETVDPGDIVDRLRLLLENNTIVHADASKDADINEEIDEYYLSKNGMGIKVTRDDITGKIKYAQGGFQLENEREGLSHNHPGILYCEPEIVGGDKHQNGRSFTMDAPLIPAARSVFSVLTNIKRGEDGEDETEFLDESNMESNPYYQFMRLCWEVEPDIIKKSGLVDENDPQYTESGGAERLEKAINKYHTFVDNKAVDYNVEFFNNYNYTVFAPNNEAVLQAIQNGLPTWKTIKDKFDTMPKDNEGNLTNRQDSLELQYDIVYLTNFVRTHFADRSVFADKSEISSPEELFTNSYDRKNYIFTKVFYKRENRGAGTTLMVRDEFSNDWKEASNDYKYKNIMTCDRICSKIVKNANTLRSATTVASSYAVVHLIDGVLNHTELDGDRYPSYTDSREAREYIKKFAIR